MRILLATAATLALAGGYHGTAQAQTSEGDTMTQGEAEAESIENYFAQESTLPFKAPDFTKIAEEDYMPAFEQGMAIQKAEVQAIIDNPEPPTFANTIVALEKSGRMLGRVGAVFFHLTGTNTTDALDEINTEISPVLAAHSDSITLNPQKLLGITKASSLLLLRDRSLLRMAFATGLPYMESPSGESHGGEIGLQGTRPAEVLKLWLGLRQLGEQGISEVLNGALERRRILEQLLSSDQLLLLGGSLHLLACRPRGANERETERWSQTARKSLLKDGFLLSRPRYGGHYWLKAVLGNPHTTTAALEQLADRVLASLNG